MRESKTQCESVSWVVKWINILWKKIDASYNNNNTFVWCTIENSARLKQFFTIFFVPVQNVLYILFSLIFHTFNAWLCCSDYSFCLMEQLSFINVDTKMRLSHLHPSTPQPHFSFIIRQSFVLLYFMFNNCHWPFEI